MRLLSHTHINGNGTKHRNEYARILARGARKRKYTHIVLGCHGNYFASKQLMQEIKRDFKVIPIRYTELSLEPKGSRYGHSHIAFMNIPEHPFDGYKEGCPIEKVMPYAQKVKCKIVLCHPESIEEIHKFSPFIHGYEVINGLDSYQRNYMYRDASRYYPNLLQFNGADYHVWEAMGNMDYFTDLPDNWFGKLYE